jgi:small redox-active disulfide protein 2
MATFGNSNQGVQTMKLQIYGSGCSKCKLLTANAETAAKTLGLQYDVEKITDINAIIDAGVMRTPALAVDGELMVQGSVASPAELEKLLHKAR